MTEERLDNGSPGGQIALYDAPDGGVALEVRLEQQTVWLTQRQMADVFDTTLPNVNMHLKAVFADGELDPGATVKDFLMVRSEGQRTVRRTLTHYNLEAIISVGYRVNSKRAVRFRRWATRTLNEHLVRGYTLNQSRLAERGLREAREALELLARTFRGQGLVTGADAAVLEFVTRYADTWRLLLEYDEDRLDLPPGTQPATAALPPEHAVRAVAAFKTVLIARGEASELFGMPRGKVLESILGNIEQTMFGESLYRSREEKAANLLYFLVKNHPFIDGNKRIASLLFLLYLGKEGLDHDFNPRPLTALTLLIAESAPASKDLMVRLVVNLLAEPVR